MIIGRYESSKFFVSTMMSFDNDEHLYETAIAHPEYLRGAWITVEEYDERKEAESGHFRWIKRLNTEPLPPVLYEVTSGLAGKISDGMAGSTTWRIRVRRKEN